MPHRFVTRFALVLLLPFPLACASLHRVTDPPCRADLAPVRDLEATSLHYQGTFSAGGRTMPATSSLTVTPHPAGGWAVVERAQLPRGVAVDSARLDAYTLAPQERISQQGPKQIALRFAAQHVTGVITTAGQPRGVSAGLCGSLFGDGAGAFLVIGRLPLRAGYRAHIRHFDVQTVSTTARQLAVVGSGRVSVPAGNFDTWTVEISAVDSSGPSTVWVDKASLVPVKFLAAQGTVTIAMDLVR